MLIFRRPIGTAAFLGGLHANLTEFTRSWGRMIAYTYEYCVQRNEFLHVDDSKTSHHSSARNHLTRTFLGDWLFMTDIDHSFEPDLLARLLGLMTKHNIGVVSGLYQYRNPPYLPNVFWWSAAENAYVAIAELDWDKPLWGGVGLCVGAGALLVHREILDAVRQEFHCDPFEEMPSYVPNKNYSEDYSFFTRLRLMGIPAYVAPMVHSYHLRVQPTTLDEYDPSQVESERFDPRADRAAEAAGASAEPQ